MKKESIETQENLNKNTQNTRPIKKTRAKFTKQWKKRYIPIISSFAAAFFICLALVFIIPTKHENATDGIQNNSGWPAKVIAPFIDTTYWVPLNSSYSLGGVANVGKVAEETDLRYFNFAFINPSTNTPTSSDGTINWCWGGYDSLGKNSTSDNQYQGILQSMQGVKDIGGDITISVGGQLGKAPWVVSNNEQKLYEMYKDIVETYGIKRLDLDIEESNQGEKENQINARAIKRLQDETGIDIILTIPIMPDGWKDKQLKVINAYLDAGVEITLINSMTMCYGYGVAANEDYGDASVRAMESANKQMIELYKARDITLTEQQAYARMGATVAIGYDSDLYPTFTSPMAQKVARHAKEKSYGMLSFWSVGRDAQLQYNKGVNSKYEFLNVMYEYLG